MTQEERYVTFDEAKGAARWELQERNGRAAIPIDKIDGMSMSAIKPNRTHSLLAPIRAWQRFIQIEAAGGIVLLAATLLALVWANSAYAPQYFALIHWPFGIAWGDATISRSAQWLINDGLMVLFFFVVGLELRREIKRGVLSTWRGAALPVAAAFGGMLMPALIYLMIAGNSTTRAGWGIPTATDIAFALGMLTVLGKRVPTALRVLLLALAVIDDLGAIVIIALFYSGPIHPAIAGVALGMLTPVTSNDGKPSPADRLLESLHPWVAFGIMPLFAFANAGLAIDAAPLDATSWRVAFAVTLGLVVGKPIGVLVLSGFALRVGWASLPSGLRPRHLVVLGIVAGIGFTMALFVAQLAFSDTKLLAAAKLGILIASAVAAALSLLIGRHLLTEK